MDIVWRVSNIVLVYAPRPPTPKLLCNTYSREYLPSLIPDHFCRFAMQNRLVVVDIPPSITRLPNASLALRDLVEEHGCWVDRFAFLPSKRDATKNKAAFELHIENVRDKAVKSLNNLMIMCNEDGEIIWSGHTDTKKQLSMKEEIQPFKIRSFPANATQSKKLIELCPSINSELDDVDTAWEEKMKKQLLKLPCDVQLIVRRSDESGGTGSNPWRGGLILATQLCIWSSKPRIEVEDMTTCGVITFEKLFNGKIVLELGAGSSGLPSLALAKMFLRRRDNINMISSDGVDEIVNALKRNVLENQLDDYIRVKHIDWNDESTFSEEEADAIIFSDCIYNEEGAVALHNVIRSILKVGGMVIGVLPDFRVGLDLFEKLMQESNFNSTLIPLLDYKENGSNVSDFACSGGGGKDYRLMIWKDCRVKDKSSRY